MKTKLTLSLWVSVALLIGCSGGGSSSGSSAKETGYLIDSPIVGMEYECGKRSGFTGQDGSFGCDTMPVVFRIGDYVVASLDNIPSDSKVYPQDLLGLDRSNSTDTSLVELVQFLQALDDDGDITSTININEETHESFEGIENDNSGSDVPNGPQSPEEAGRAAGLPLPNPVTAMDHLRKTITPENYRAADTSDLSPYVGSWAGGGWGWEVRFKHNSGDFVSQFTGTDQNDLPFDGEKTIMSLMVTHQTAFSFEVDEYGDISGEGVIVYDVLPNLCGLNALTTNLLNPAVGFFDKIFTLGGIVGADRTMAAIQGNVKFDNIILDSVLPNVDAAAAFAGKDWASQIADMAKLANSENKQTSDICRGVTENPNVSGGLSVGPLSLDELLSNASIDVAKSLLTPTQPFGFILNIPGLTQIQYEYKGLQNGPETRSFDMSGYINDNGEMYLSLDWITDGSDYLTIEYTVNWQTETPTFPTWSPFLDGAGTVYPPSRDVVVYDYVTHNVQKSYNDYSLNSTPTQKTVNVPTPALVPESMGLSQPMATFKESGTKRNGVSVWHEYEYGWNAYKVNN